MAEQKPLILQIQEDCLNSSIPVVQILRKAKVASTKLELADFLKWINDELDGYTGNVEDLPSYRMLTGAPKAYNPYHGWQAIIFQNPDTAKVLSTAPINQAIGPMEEMILDSRENKLIFPYHPKTKTQIISILEYPTDVHLELSEGALSGIVDKVRNILLDWTLELEKSGVLGEGVSFSSHDKVEATAVTQHFYADNIAVTGQVNDQASVTNIQNSYRSPVDINAVLDFARQVNQSISQLPVNIQTDAQKYTNMIIEEANKGEPEHSRIKSLLTSLKSVCVGAAGNLTAQGIMSMIGKFM